MLYIFISNLIYSNLHKRERIPAKIIYDKIDLRTKMFLKMSHTNKICALTNINPLAICYLV